MTVHRAVVRAVVATLVVALGAFGAIPAVDAAGTVPDGRRVLVISLPGLTWDEVDDDLPAIRAVLADSAVANVALRVRRLATEPGEGYATIGAGTRAVADRTVAGFAFDAAEAFDEGTAADEFRRQAGRALNGDVVVLGWSRLERDNARSEFDADLGTLGDVLAEAGVERGVVANADGADLLAAREPLHREAALALADEHGVVPCGTVGRSLLVDDPGAAFGVRLDPDRVTEEAQRCLDPGSVVLVEASDLRRTAVYGARLDEASAAAMRDRALRAADRMVDELVAGLDPDRDAVVVVAPSVTTNVPRLTVLGIRAAEHPAGLLRSGNTRQDGYVTLADLTPTIAALAGAPLDESTIEGRTVEVGDTGGSASTRRDALVDADAAARFRDRALTPVAAGFIAFVSLLGIATAVVLWRDEKPPAALEYASLAALGVLPMTYLAALLPFHDWGAAAYAAFVVAGAAALGGLYAALRTRWLRPLVAAYSVLLGVVGASVVLLDSRLQTSTVFGDSPIVAGRFYGINNVTFAQVVVGAALIATILTHRSPSRSRVAVPVFLGAVLLVVAAPMWGADVGGALAGVPALGYLAARLGGWRIRARTVVAAGVVTLAVVVGLGLLDLTREPADRSHLGRLLERIGGEGAHGLWTVVERKLEANLRSLTNSVWRFILPPVLVGAAVVAWRAPGRLRELFRDLPELRTALAGVLVAAVLGYAVNDSGIAVPGMMLATLVPGITYLLARARG